MDATAWKDETMRLYLIPIWFGWLGVMLFWMATHVSWFPDSLAVTAFPGTMISFALIHSSQGALWDVALIAGAVVQFGVFALAETIVATIWGLIRR